MRYIDLSGVKNVIQETTVYEYTVVLNYPYLTCYIVQQTNGFILIFYTINLLFPCISELR